MLTVFSSIFKSSFFLRKIKSFFVIASLLSFPVLGIASAPVFAGDAEFYTSKHDNFGAGGYDVLTFFAGTPAPGIDAYTYTWKNTEWRFTNQENMDSFIANPEKYAPAYGGYCAWAIGHKNALFKGDPKYWSVRDGRLYLNYNKGVKKKWLKNPDGFIVKGDQNWLTILKK